MDWSFTISSFVATLTSAIISYFLVSQYQFPVEKMVELISLNDFENAGMLWNKIITKQDSDNSVINPTEIFEQIFQKSFEMSENISSSAGISTKLSKFIRLSLNKSKSEKPRAYYELYKIMLDKNLVFNNKEIFQVAKHILEDNAQNVKISGTKSGTLFATIPNLVWSSLLQRNIMIRNKLTATYLYINADGQMLGWNNRLTNERQAVFKLRPKVSNDNLNFDLTYANTNLGVRNNLNTSDSNELFSIYKEQPIGTFGSEDLFWSSWTLELLSFNTLRIFIDVKNTTGILTVQRPSQKDDPRSTIYVDVGNSILETEHSPSTWEIINYYN